MQVQITNATKAQLIAVVNAAFGLLTAFNVLLTQTQMGAITAVVDAVALLFVGVTYKGSPARKAGFKSGRAARRGDPMAAELQRRIADSERRLEIPDHPPAPVEDPRPAAQASPDAEE